MKTITIAISTLLLATLVACGGGAKVETNAGMEAYAQDSVETIDDIAQEYKALVDRSNQLQQSSLNNEDDDSAVPQEIEELKEDMTDLVEENKATINQLPPQQKAQFFGASTTATSSTKQGR